MIAKTPEESAELLRRRPINWDELGSSEKDLWEERHLRAMRKAADRQRRSEAI
ncbi:hypothetical protein MICABA_00443 [Microbacterium sp. T2.11-28]|nr:hypothetical protein MICABA_00443 [Microbacterium sp. T2.11-28]